MYPELIAFNAQSINGEIGWVEHDLNCMLHYYKASYNWRVDAVIMGSNSIQNLGNEDDTILDDKILEKSPIPKDFKDIVYYPLPYLIVPDSKGQITNWKFIQIQPWFRKIVVLCTQTTPKLYLNYLKSRKINYRIVGESRVDFKFALKLLKKKYEINKIRLDCGNNLKNHFIELGLLKKINLLVFSKYIAENNLYNLKKRRITQINEEYYLLETELIK